jgi:hypothetical protein
MWRCELSKSGADDELPAPQGGVDSRRSRMAARGHTPTGSRAPRRRSAPTSCFLASNATSDRKSSDGRVVRVCGSSRALGKAFHVLATACP